MSIARPISKDMMRRLLLKILHDIDQPGSEVAGYSSQDRMIIGELLPRKILRVDRLTEQEAICAHQALDELRRIGYIVQNPRTPTPNVYILTESGRAEARKSIDQMKLITINIEDLLSRPDLLNKVRADYESGDYDSAIFKAFKMLEESVREKSKEPANVLGVNLMSAAFRDGGKLSHPEIQVIPEREALHQLMRGAIGWFKNPGSHRTVGHDDPLRTAQILGFANALLDMVDQCTIVG
jgi:uncharacterized protein (TIGR02391 family)